jgi:hypothetical protein
VRSPHAAPLRPTQAFSRASHGAAAPTIVAQNTKSSTGSSIRHRAPRLQMSRGARVNTASHLLREATGSRQNPQPRASLPSEKRWMENDTRMAIAERGIRRGVEPRVWTNLQSSHPLARKMHNAYNRIQHDPKMNHWSVQERNQRSVATLMEGTHAIAGVWRSIWQSCSTTAHLASHQIGAAPSICMCAPWRQKTQRQRLGVHGLHICSHSACQLPRNGKRSPRWATS